VSAARWILPVIFPLAAGCTFLDPLDDLQPPPGAKPSFGFVQASAATPQAKVRSVTVVLGHPELGGDMTVVAIGWNDARQSIQEVKDDNGNMYEVAAPTFRAMTTSQAIYFAPVVGAGPNAVTVEFDAGAVDPDVRVFEYTVHARAPELVGAAANAGTGTEGSVTVEPTAAGELVVAAGVTRAAFDDAGPGFEARLITMPDGDIVEDQITSGAGPVTASGTINGPLEWLMQAAVFR
jgi:hypothetical protein